MRAAILLTGILFLPTVSFAQPKPYVLLVSFDGFRYDYVERFKPSFFATFIAEGSQAKSLIPCYPSKTFPNHYTLVTGLYPAHHGLVDNDFYDTRKREHYQIRNRKVMADADYYGGTPLWQLASKHGIKSASCFWVGSETATGHPDYYLKYDATLSNTDRIDQVLTWLSLPEQDRPHFITVYFSLTDDIGHQYGPESDTMRSAVLEADKILERLVNGIDKKRLPVNIIVVSDHGMKAIAQADSSYVLVPEVLAGTDTTGLVYANAGSQVHLYQPDAVRRDKLYADLKQRETTYRVLLQSELPAHWQYRSPRIGDILLVAKSGYYFLDRDRSQLKKVLKPWGWAGVHGYDASEGMAMHGIFYGRGPNIRPGYTLESFENIHIYPLIARILDLPIPVIDGKLSVTDRIYRRFSRQR